MAGVHVDESRVGRVFEHEIRRAVIEAKPGKAVVNGAFMPGPMAGVSAGDSSPDAAIANPGPGGARFPGSPFRGDAIPAETESIELKEGRARSGRGIVAFPHRAFNLCGKTAIRRERPNDGASP